MEKRFFLRGGGSKRESKLTYIIFVYRVWEACHLNEVTDLRETSQTRTIEARFLKDLNQSGGARRLFLFPAVFGSVGSLRGL